jgi:glutathione synthase
MTLAQIAAYGRLGDANALYVRPDGTKDGEEVLVSVTYFRAGYAPTDYPTEVEWNARKMIEKSAATKCPTISYQLAGE